MEAEYITLEKAAKQIKSMYSALSVAIPKPAELKGDNNRSIAIAENKQNHNWVKHIDIQHHFIRHCIEEGDISIAYVPSANNLADLFTKPLPQVQHAKFCAAL